MTYQPKKENNYLDDDEEDKSSKDIQLVIAVLVSIALVSIIVVMIYLVSKGTAASIPEVKKSDIEISCYSGGVEVLNVLASKVFRSGNSFEYIDKDTDKRVVSYMDCIVKYP